MHEGVTCTRLHEQLEAPMEDAKDDLDMAVAATVAHEPSPVVHEPTIMEDFETGEHFVRRTIPRVLLLRAQCQT